MDPESIGKETIIRVTDWLHGIWKMRRRTSPVQQWVDSIPSPSKTNTAMSTKSHDESLEKSDISLTPTEPKDIPISMQAKPPSMTVSAPINVPNSSAVSVTGVPSSVTYRLVRDPSLQSDSSHCSSVESLLELRKADPEAILLGLGFGGCSNSPQQSGSLSRIPKRFLQPSKLKGIAINDFVKHQQETSESFDSVSLGYRGLTGSPYVAPSEIVQKIMERLREHESHENDPYAMYNCYEQYSPLQQNGTLSVLSPDSRQFLERPRSKSPDMCNKRMIIGQKSFAFGHDGDLIEINPSSTIESLIGSSNNDHKDVKNYKTPTNFEVVNTKKEKIIENTLACKVEARLSKQPSFDDCIEICNIDTKPITQTNENNVEVEYGNLDHINCKKNVSNTPSIEKIDGDAPKHCIDIRRASDGSCKTQFSETAQNVEGRRHSDSTMHNIGNSNSECTLPQKRKTLKRQSRISEMDAISYCNSTFVSNTTECEPNEINSYKYSTNNESRQLERDQGSNELLRESECCGAMLSNTFTEGTNSGIEMVDGSRKTPIQFNDTSFLQNDELCYEENIQQPCSNDENCTSCCCRPERTKYWKKMDKIIQENKKLENMVAKSRREMAEIREMLNSVLSVRMEPGF